MPKMFGGEPERQWEQGVREETVMNAVIAEYIYLGKGQYGEQGQLVLQLEEQHPNGIRKEARVWFNLVLGTLEHPSKIREIIHAVFDKVMPDDVAEEKGFDPEDLVGVPCRVYAKNKVKTYTNDDGEEVERTFIEIKDWHPAKDTKLEIEGYKPISERGQQKSVKPASSSNDDPYSDDDEIPF